MFLSALPDDANHRGVFPRARCTFNRPIHSRTILVSFYVPGWNCLPGLCGPPEKNTDELIRARIHRSRTRRCPRPRILGRGVDELPNLANQTITGKDRAGGEQRNRGRGRRRVRG